MIPRTVGKMHNADLHITSSSPPSNSVGECVFFDLQQLTTASVGGNTQALCVLLLGMYLVGVVEVKRPGNNVLLEPTVLGELLDQMLLVEGFYGMGPVIGILTTAEEWIISWFPVDSEALVHIDPPEASFTTSMNLSYSTSIHTKGHSPPGGTPSQQLGAIHSVRRFPRIRR